MTRIVRPVQVGLALTASVQNEPVRAADPKVRSQPPIAIEESRDVGFWRRIGVQSKARDPLESLAETRSTDNETDGSPIDPSC